MIEEPREINFYGEYCGSTSSLNEEKNDSTSSLEEVEKNSLSTLCNAPANSFETFSQNNIHMTRVNNILNQMLGTIRCSL